MSIRRVWDTRMCSCWHGVVLTNPHSAGMQPGWIFAAWAITINPTNLCCLCQISTSAEKNPTCINTIEYWNWVRTVFMSQSVFPWVLSCQFWRRQVVVTFRKKTQLLRFQVLIALLRGCHQFISLSLSFGHCRLLRFWTLVSSKTDLRGVGGT